MIGITLQYTVLLIAAKRDLPLGLGHHHVADALVAVVQVLERVISAGPHPLLSQKAGWHRQTTYNGPRDLKPGLDDAGIEFVVFL